MIAAQQSPGIHPKPFGLARAASPPYLRSLIDKKFTPEQLLRAKHPADENRAIKSAADLTLGKLSGC